MRKGAKPVAKKTAAKKSAAPALAKKVSSAKTKKSASADPVSGLANNIAEAITTGKLDGYLTVLDDALLERTTELSAKDAAKTTKKSASSSKTVTEPPKRTRTVKEESVTPVEGKTYMVTNKHKSLGGAKVKFIRTSQKSETKAVIEMVDSKPGFPKGKQAMLLKSALVAVPAKK